MHGKPARASFTLHRGEVLGIAGLVGAGRTELLRALFGLDPVVSGKVKLGTASIRGRPTPARRWAQGLALLSEDRKERRAGARPQRRRQPDAVEAAGAWCGPARRRAAAERWIERLARACQSADQPIGELSGGNQQKVALARLLHHDVDVLLLDEPTRGIDVATKAQIYELIDALVAKERPAKAVLMVSATCPSCSASAIASRSCAAGASGRRDRWRKSPSKPCCSRPRWAARARPHERRHRRRDRRVAGDWSAGRCSRNAAALARVGAAAGVARGAQEPGRVRRPRRRLRAVLGVAGRHARAQLRRPGQSGDHLPPDHDRGRGRAGHDGRDRGGRHRSLRRLDHRARHRGHRRLPARRRAARARRAGGRRRRRRVRRAQRRAGHAAQGGALHRDPGDHAGGARHRQGPGRRPEDRRAPIVAERAPGAAARRARVDGVPGRRVAAVPARLRGGRAAALYAIRPARVRRRLERADRAPVRRAGGAREARGLLARRLLRRHRRPDAVLAADRRRPDRRHGPRAQHHRRGGHRRRQPGGRRRLGRWARSSARSSCRSSSRAARRWAGPTGCRRSSPARSSWWRWRWIGSGIGASSEDEVEAEADEPVGVDQIARRVLEGSRGSDGGDGFLVEKSQAARLQQLDAAKLAAR